MEQILGNANQCTCRVNHFDVHCPYTTAVEIEALMVKVRAKMEADEEDRAEESQGETCGTN